MTPEKQVNINDEREIRLKKLDDLKKIGINPYPARSIRNQILKQALDEKEGFQVQVAGRIITKREMGRIIFCHLQDETGKIQIAFKQDNLEKDNYKLFGKKIDPGDIVSIEGERFKTKKGEESILVKKWTLLAKAVIPLPDKFHGLQDEELKLRKRYLELITDPETKELFRRKSKFWSATREFLLQEGFLEVETPVLETTVGGADATPFVTHHNALDMDVYLRISMGELWQKRLMVGGFEKTFEIGRQFRNEGMSREHLQDYTQMEFYWAYADYEKGMELVEQMFKYIAKKTFGTLEFNIGEFKNIDLSKKWEHIDYIETVKKHTGIDVLKANEEDIKKKLDEFKIKYEKHENKGRLADSLWKYCRKSIKGPAFLVNTPVMVSPLAKRKEDNSELTERFQPIIAGSELGNGYSELNDPLDQAKRFEEQALMREAGDSEAQMHDKDFVEALEHGMPPTCGFGFSERLFAFFENKPVRECQFFPLMKPENQSSTLAPNHNSTILKNIDYKLPISRDEALKFVEEYTKKAANLHHYLESEVVMRGLAKHLGKDEEYWGMLGLLHDIDWEITEHDPTTHLTEAPTILREKGFDEDFINIILSHGYGFECAGFQDKKRNKELEYALACSETVTGLIYATALMRPNKIMDLKVKSVKKKMKDKKFAANVDREIIKECEKIGVSLDDFLKIAVEAMRKIAGEIELV